MGEREVVNADSVISTSLDDVSMVPDVEFLNDLSLDDWLNIRDNPDLPGHEQLLERIPFEMVMLMMSVSRKADRL